MQKSYVIATVIALGAVAWVLSGQFKAEELPAAEPAAAAGAPEAPKKAPPEAPLVRVADLVARPMMNEVVLNGRTESARVVQLKSETRGRVEQVLAERGARVKAGDPILRIAVNERQAQLAEARALLAQRQIEFDAAQKLSSKGFESEVKVADARAKLDAARAIVTRAELELAKTTVAAPFEGILAERPAEIGAYLDAGSAAATIVDLDPVKIVGQVSERNIGELRIGAMGKGQLLGTHRVQGRVTYIAPSADPATRTFRVEMEVPNPDLVIREGLTAQLRVPVGERLAHLIPPSVLTLADDGTVGVKLVDSTNRVRFRPVQILGEAADGVWLDGLPREARVIMVGQEFVIDGQEVRPTLAPTAGAQ